MGRNRLLALLLPLLLCSGLKSQNIAANSLYMLNLLEHNPAFSGTRGRISTFLSSQIKWLGIAGAPKRYYLGVNAPFNRNRMGAALEIQRETIGPRSTITAMGSYAYKIPLSVTSRLSFAVRAGVINNTLGFDELNFQSKNEGFRGTASELNLRVDFGVFYNAKYFFAGASFKNLASESLSSSGYQNTQLKDVYLGPVGLNLITGYIYVVNEHVRIKTLAYLDLYNIFIPNLKLSAAVGYDKYLLGLGYSNNGDLTALLNFKLNTTLSVGYAFNYNFVVLTPVGATTHEIVLRYDYRLKRQGVGILRGF